MARGGKWLSDFQNALTSNGFCVLGTTFEFFSILMQLHGLLYLYILLHRGESVTLILWCVFVGSVSWAGPVNAITWGKTQPGGMAPPESRSVGLARADPVSRQTELHVARLSGLARDHVLNQPSRLYIPYTESKLSFWNKIWRMLDKQRSY